MGAVSAVRSLINSMVTVFTICSKVMGVYAATVAAPSPPEGEFRQRRFSSQHPVDNGNLCLWNVRQVRASQKSSHI